MDTLGLMGWHVVGSTGKVAGLSRSCGVLVMFRMLPGSPESPWPASRLLSLRSSGES
jgi:hypothetical protein